MQNDCKHPRVQNFKLSDGSAAPLWGCVDCSRRFEPITTKWTIEYHYVTSPNEEGFSEWWTVSNGARSFKCATAEQANRLQDVIKALFGALAN